MWYVGLLFVLFLFLLFFGFPIFLATGIAGLVMVFLLDIPLSLVIIRMFGGISSFSLVAIPFFVLAGNIMMVSDITDRIVDFANALVGRLKGSLGYVNILSSMLFAGIQGSGVADASAIGSIMIPTMKRQGYEGDYSVAVTASSSAIGPIIPPSVAMIMYAYYTELSVGRLFLGALIPGIVIGIGLMIAHAIIYRLRGYEIETESFHIGNVLTTFVKAIGAFIMPIIILSGIVFGVFTPTESGISAVLYGLFYGLFISRKLKLKDFPGIFLRTAKTTAIVLITLSMASIFSNVLIRLNFQRIVIALIMEHFANPYTATIVIMLLIVFIGMFADPPILIAMFSSTLLATGTVLGFEPIHYGVVMVMAIMIGAVTPPVGSMLFIACSIADVPLEKTVRVMIPFAAVLFLTAVLTLFVPSMVESVVHVFYPAT